MKLEKLIEILSSVFPTCHYDWSGYNNVPDYPYLAVIDEASDNFSADCKAYYVNENFSVELYATKNNYIEAEKEVEKVLDENEIFWNKRRIWLKNLSVFQTIYSI